MTMGMREGVMLLIALVAVYMLFVVLRMRHLRQRPLPTATAEPAPVLERAAGREEGDREAPADEDILERGEVRSLEPPAQADDAVRAGLEQDVAQLRDEVDAVRGALAALRADMHQELASLRASQTVSPIYGDAMQLAVSGYDAAAIAERCGIARAEADLVVALAKSQAR